MISDMNLQVIRLDDVKPMPWKNGGGTTRELIAWPNAEQWQWRASVAEVEKSGPFSSFPNVQRWFAVLSGDGVSLTVDGSAQELRQSDQPFRFDGAAQTSCDLLGGATQDFNLMLQGGATARMRRVSSNVSFVIDTPKIIAAYASNTPAILRFGLEEYMLQHGSLAWRQMTAGALFHMHATDALLMEITL